MGHYINIYMCFVYSFQKYSVFIIKLITRTYTTLHLFIANIPLSLGALHFSPSDYSSHVIMQANKVLALYKSRSYEVLVSE